MDSVIGSSIRAGFEPLLDSDKAAEHLGIHPKTLQRWARQGRVPSIPVGKKICFRLSTLDAWIRGIENRSQPAVCVK